MNEKLSVDGFHGCVSHLKLLIDDGEVFAQFGVVCSHVVVVLLQRRLSHFKRTDFLLSAPA